jgi:hypothetical protein
MEEEVTRRTRLIPYEDVPEVVDLTDYDRLVPIVAGWLQEEVMTDTTKDTLLELAERVEGASGPDRDLDREVAFAIDLPDRDEFGCYQSWAGLCANGVRWGDQARLKAPAYTASIDAAMTLVPEGCFPDIDCDPRNPTVEIQYLTDKTDNGLGALVVTSAATPALALVAASLRALAQRGGENG